MSIFSMKNIKLNILNSCTAPEDDQHSILSKAKYSIKNKLSKNARADIYYVSGNVFGGN